MKALLAALLVVVAVTAGCGGSADEGNRAERSIQAGEQERAESLLLVLSDLPEGWRASPSDEGIESQDRFRECLGLDFSDTTITGEADSKDFAVQETREASSQSTIFSSEKEASNNLRALAEGMDGSAGERCFRELTEETLAEDEETREGVSVDEVDVGELNVAAPADLDETKAWQIAVSFTVEIADLSTTGYIDWVVLQEGEAITELMTSDLQSPFDAELRSQLLKTLAGRLIESPAE